MMLSHEEVDASSQRAWSLISQQEYAEAQRIGEQLIDAQEEVGYRIMAMSHAAQEEAEQALAVIEQGVIQLPQSWQLQLLRGSLLSEAGDFPAALKAFDAASALPEAELHWIDINRAVVYGRTQEIDRALNLLQRIEEPEAINDAFDIQLGLLDSVGRYDLIIELAEEDLDLLQAPTSEEEAATISRILSYVASAYWYEEEDGDEIDHYVRQAIAFDRNNPDALYLLREQEPVFSDQSQIYGLLVRGRLYRQTEEDTPQPMEFVTSYEVIADSEEEALGLVRNFEIREVDPQSLQIEAVETQPNDGEEPKGIYQVGELLIPDLEDQEDETENES